MNPEAQSCPQPEVTRNWNKKFVGEGVPITKKLVWKGERYFIPILSTLAESKMIPVLIVLDMFSNSLL